MGKPEGKRSLRRPTRRWEGTIKCISNTWDRRPWPGLIWLRIRVVSGSCKQNRQPQGSTEIGKFLTSYGTICFSKKKKYCAPWSQLFLVSVPILNRCRHLPAQQYLLSTCIKKNHLNNNLTYFESALSNKLS